MDGRVCGARPSNGRVCGARRPDEGAGGVSRADETRTAPARSTARVRVGGGSVREGRREGAAAGLLSAVWFACGSGEPIGPSENTRMDLCAPRGDETSLRTSSTVVGRRPR
jgi:hypothetical protein